MAPFLMAFAPAAPGRPHPAPWKAANGSIGIDIHTELYIPLTYVPETLDRLNTIWWIIALTRLKAKTSAFVPVVSTEKFSTIPNIGQEPELCPIEFHTSRLQPYPSRKEIIDIADLQWVKDNWRAGATLFSVPTFNVAFQAIDSSIWNSSAALGTVAVWGGLERLFSANTQELSFRVSANLAAYLEAPGRDRYKVFKQVKSLYDHRSKAAHGDAGTDIAPYQSSYALARSALLKIIELRHVPEKWELEALLFGDSVSGTSPSGPQ